MGFQTFRRAAAMAGVSLLALVPAVRVAQAQAIIRGVLYDDAKGTPIRGTVMLVDPATDAPVVNTPTDSLGQFQLKASRGTYQLAAVHEGYQSVLSAPIALANGEQMIVKSPIGEGDTQHKIGVLQHIRPATAEAEAQQVPAGMSGFMTRGATGSGLRYDRSRLAASPYRTVGEFLQNVPGFEVTNPSSANSMMLLRTHAMVMGPSMNGGGSCQLGWFLDGHRMNKPGMGDDAATDGLAGISLNALQGIEVFRGVSEMPAEFADPDLRCGAVALWSRRG
jgi:hypothetical protein